MHFRRCNLKHASFVVTGCLLLYLIFSSGYHKFEIDAVIDDARPHEVWEYVADFNKMRLLNPTILHFTILSDSGHAHDWRYTVRYTEKLSHWPYWLNTAEASYAVTKTMPDVIPALYVIKSAHMTCFFGGFYCLHAFSEFEFSAKGKDTYCLEKIQYQCPPFLNNVCRRELVFQRKAVMHNLTTIFGRQQQNTF